MKRRYTAPPDSERCECDRKPLSDGSGAWCMRRKAKGSRFCAQHTRLKQISDAEVDAYIKRLAAADLAAGIE